MAKVTRKTLLGRVNDHLAEINPNRKPLTMKQFQQAVSIARAKRLMREDALDRVAKGRR